MIGVRTSGSFLAPLYAAYFRSAGFHDVRVLTIRPGRTHSRRERDALRAARPLPRGKAEQCVIGWRLDEALHHLWRAPT